MRSQRIASAPLLLSIFLGCDNDPGAGKERAAVSAPVEQAPRAASDGEKTTTYSFSQNGSSLEFVGAKVTGKHDGGFGEFEGTFAVPEGNPVKGQVEVTVKTSSVSADAEKLTAHLKSADFFDAEKYPTATFTSTHIKEGGVAGATHTVTGNLRLHGIAKSISFPATITVSESEAKVSAEFVINRKDFGIEYPGKPDDLIKDDVLIKLKISAKAG